MPYFRGKNKFKHLEIAQGGVFQYHETGGTTFFVNGETGSNGKSGLSPADAKLTVKAALDLCTANKHDVVYILNYSSEAQVYEEWPIVVDVDQVHIIGV